MNKIKVSNVGEIQDAVRTHTALLPKGGGSKSALSQSHSTINGSGIEPTQIDLSALSGILEYQPGEYTFTARAGTPVTEVEAALAKNGQYLPFEPPLDQHGATLGGTVAAGLSGSARYRYGGVRDFLIGLRFVDGNGQLVTGGGKVVKNAAGFDLPKLMVGSLGRFAILTELSFKVFPQPQTFITLLLAYDSLAAGVDAVRKLTTSPYDIEALDLVPTANGAQVEIRLGGLNNVLTERAERILSYLDVQPDMVQSRLSNDADAEHWRSVRNFEWAETSDAGAKMLVKVPTTPAKIADLDRELMNVNAPRRYCVGGNLAWVAWPNADAALHQLLTELGLSGLVIRGDVSDPMIGVRTGQYFAQRLKSALDPDDRFLGL